MYLFIQFLSETFFHFNHILEIFEFDINYIYINSLLTINILF